jgi:2'-5' RNA ligase
VRLFVALDVPEETRERLRGLIASLKPECPNARWVRPEGIHVTLKFIGHVASEKFDSFVAALASVYPEQARISPVEVQFCDAGFFPDEHRPRVLWCGVKASPNLAQLAREIEHVLEPLGVPSESRPFTPHITLARFKTSQDPQRLTRALGDGLEMRDFGSARETAFHLFESILKPSGAEYKRLRSFSFAKEAA